MFIITFFASIQYVFLAWVPSNVTNFAFLCLTSLIGFLIVFAVFFNELFRVDITHIKQSIVLSLMLFFYNLFVLFGSKGINATTISCVLSSYFIFVPIVEFIMYKSRPQKSTIIAIFVVLVGIFFMMDCRLETLLNINILFLIIADIFFAVYIVTIGKYASGSNPSILALGQLFFNFVIALICWIIESIITKNRMTFPSSSAFWGGVIFISFFIRAFYGVIQIYAQRFVSALNTSLIFSTEIIMTMIASSAIASFFGMVVPNDEISTFRVIGAIVMVFGILIADPSVIEGFLSSRKKENV